jgi:hypothetical protein
MSRFHRWILKTARMLHLYTTLFGLALILFFAITGFMLNHMEWFLPDDARLESLKRTDRRPLPLDKMPGGKLPEPNDDGEPTAEGKLAVVEALRKEFDIRGEMQSVQFVTVNVPKPNSNPDAEPEEKKVLLVEFLRSGGTVVATIDRTSAMTDVVWNNQGWPIVMTDLHRGNRGNLSNEVKRTGRVWSFVIDATCILLLIISATGLVMWWSLKTRGKWTALLILGGGLVSFAMYYWFVP